MKWLMFFMVFAEAAMAAPSVTLNCQLASPRQSETVQLRLHLKVDGSSGSARFDLLGAAAPFRNIVIEDNLVVAGLNMKLENALEFNIPKAEIQALVDGHSSATSLAVLSTSPEVGQLTARGCELASEGPIITTDEAFIRDLNVENTGKPGTLYPLRKNLDLGNLSVFCVHVEALTSNHTDWPVRKYCSFTFKKIDADDGSIFSNIVGDDASRLFEALPIGGVTLALESPRSRMTLACESMSHCQVTAE